jgi:hypothetical protein
LKGAEVTCSPFVGAWNDVLSPGATSYQNKGLYDINRVLKPALSLDLPALSFDL